jgi:hypothetical protein
LIRTDTCSPDAARKPAGATKRRWNEPATRPSRMLASVGIHGGSSAENLMNLRKALRERRKRRMPEPQRSPGRRLVEDRETLVRDHLAIAHPASASLQFNRNRSFPDAARKVRVRRKRQHGPFGWRQHVAGRAASHRIPATKGDRMQGPAARCGLY